MYIVKELKGTYISREALEDLGVISKYFPNVPPRVGKDEVAEVVAIKQKKGVVSKNPMKKRGWLHVVAR